jgi:hypothetical protein
VTTDRGYYFGSEGAKATPEYLKSIDAAHKPESLAKVLARITELDRKIAALPAGEGKRKLSETSARLAKLLENIEGGAPAAKAASAAPNVAALLARAAVGRLEGELADIGKRLANLEKSPGAPPP